MTPADSAASGLPAYTTGSGARNGYAWPAVIWRFHPSWALGAGVFCQRLLGGAADSPIVTERGSPNQRIDGAGIGYLWNWRRAAMRVAVERSPRWRKAFTPRRRRCIGRLRC